MITFQSKGRDWQNELKQHDPMFSIKNILELTIQKGWMENDGKICHEKIKQLRAGVAEQISDKTAFRQNNILEIK